MEKGSDSKEAHKPPENMDKKPPRTFPRHSMEQALVVAALVHEKADGECSQDQLAAYLNYKNKKNGAYRAQLGSASAYGFIQSVRGSRMLIVTDSALAILAPVRESDSLKSKINAFYSIPLFQSLSASLMGAPLPSEDGLLNLLKTKFEIPTDKAARALRSFMKSAKYAHFFECDSNRLIEPVIKTDNEVSENQSEETGTDHSKKENGGGQSLKDPPPRTIHPSLLGLLNELPVTGPWKKSQKEGFLQAFKSTLDFIHPDEEEGNT